MPELSGSVAAASQVISLAKAAAQGPDEVAEEWRPHYDVYQEALRTSGACDYDDILLDLLRLLEGDAARAGTGASVVFLSADRRIPRPQRRAV